MDALAKARKLHEESCWDKIRAAGPAAAQVLIDVMMDVEERGSIRIQAAAQILDRGGYKTPEIIVTGVRPYETREELVASLSAVPQDILTEAMVLASKTK